MSVGSENRLQISVVAFGSLKDFIPKEIVLNLASGVLCSDIFEEIQKETKSLMSQSSTLGDINLRFAQFQEILSESVLATSKKTLSLDEKLFGNESLAILPPVCGG